MRSRHTFTLILAAAMTLASCTKEQPFESVIPLNDGDIAFVIKNAATKSGVNAPAATGVSIPVVNAESGDGFFLEETIENLNPGVATKGAPAYTVNVGDLYSTMDVYAAVGSSFSEEAVFEKMDWYRVIARKNAR